MKTAIFVGLMIGSCASAIGAQKFNPEGYWLTEQNDAKVHIYRCGERLCGKIIDLKEKCRDGQPKIDTETKQPTIGLEIVRNFKAAGDNSWEEGTVRDPKEGKTYSGTIEMVNENQLNLRGYVGIQLFGRTSEWRRTTKEAKVPGSQSDQSCKKSD